MGQDPREYEDEKPGGGPEKVNSSNAKKVGAKDTNVNQVQNEEEKPFTCVVYMEETAGFCHKSFASEKELEEHLYESHGMPRQAPPCTCPPCRHQFGGKKSFYQRLREDFHKKPKR